MAYTTIKKPSDYFNTKLFTGTGAEQSISSLDFSPDLTWIKNRDTTDWHRLLDSVRGATKELYSNDSSAETTEAQSLKSFDSNGFTLGTLAEVNTSGENYASWNWRGSDSSAVSNTDGSITSTVSANTTSGFSIVSFTGTGSTATVGHGLGATPKMIIVKNRSITETWRVYHNYLGGGQALALNGTQGTDTDASYWSNTNPTSSVFTVGTNTGTNGSGNSMIAYCFADVKGFSKFGSYTGNGSADGAFVYTGFKPAMVIGKASSRADVWWMHDNKRDTINPMNRRIMPNLSSEESVEWVIDYLSNGFKIRMTDAQANGSGETYIYMAFAEQPLVGDNPATAR